MDLAPSPKAPIVAAQIILKCKKPLRLTIVSVRGILALKMYLIEMSANFIRLWPIRQWFRSGNESLLVLCTLTNWPCMRQDSLIPFVVIRTTVVIVVIVDIHVTPGFVVIQQRPIQLDGVQPDNFQIFFALVTNDDVP
jgi:hypothetical protein